MRVYIVLITALLECMLLLACYAADESAPVVHLQQGSVEGKVIYAKGLKIPAYVYLGIPYAAPPVGKLRFQPPQPREPWDGVLEAKEYSKKCMQLPAILDLLPLHSFIVRQYSEDCLTVNVFTPKLDAKLPVLVFIHGGGFEMGMAELADGTAFATFENIVVVTLNYRVGALGFLSTGDESATSNNGLRDQQMALLWVKENIEKFGGDPERVTLAGESAGSWSVTFHLLSPASKGLFHSAISMSGSLLLSNGIVKDPKKHAVYVAEKLGCDTSSSVSLVTCLQGKSAEEIVNSQHDFTMATLRWLPAIDNSTLLNFPQQLFQKGDFHRVPYLGMLTSDEGMELVRITAPNFGTAPFTKENFLGALTMFLKNYYPNNLEAVIDEVLNFYISKDEKTLTEDYLRKRFVEILGAALMNAPTIQTLRYHSVHAPSYFGLVSYRPSFTHSPSWIPGASHGEEQVYVWGYALLDHPISQQVAFVPEEVHLTRQIMKYLGNFIKKGDPNQHDLTVWPRFTSPEEEFMDLRPFPSANKGFQSRVTDFWMTTLPYLGGDKKDKSKEHSEL